MKRLARFVGIAVMAISVNAFVYLCITSAQYSAEMDPASKNEFSFLPANHLVLVGILTPINFFVGAWGLLYWSDQKERD